MFRSAPKRDPWTQQNFRLRQSERERFLKLVAARDGSLIGTLRRAMKLLEADVDATRKHNGGGRPNAR